MIDTLRSAGAGGDRLRRRVPRATAEDEELRAAIERAGPQLLLAATRIDSDGQGQILGGPADELSASVGYAGFPISVDGAYRQVDESVGLSGAERVRAGDTPAGELRRSSPPGSRAIPSSASSERGSTTTGPRARSRTSPSRTCCDGADPSRFENKVVVVGTSARRAGRPARDGGRRRSGDVGRRDPGERDLDAAPRSPARQLGAAGDRRAHRAARRPPGGRRDRRRPMARRSAGRGGGGRLPRSGAARCSPRAGSSPCCIPCSPWLLSAVAVFAVRAAVARRRLSAPGLTLTRLR